MRIDPLKQYAALRQQLLQEKTNLEARLSQINLVLGAAPPSTAVPPRNARGARRPGQRVGNVMSMREAVAKALSAEGPLTRKELVEAVERLGYVFSTSNPLNSMGVILYGKRSPFKKKKGRFYLPAGARIQTAAPQKSSAASPKRTMSPEARARISAAQRARWARQKRAAKQA